MKHTLLLLFLLPLLSFGQETNDTQADSSVLTAVDYFQKGNANYEKDQYNAAISDYTIAIKINPEYAEAYNKRGLSYSAVGIQNMAISDFLEAIRINPDYAEAYHNRGKLYERLGKNSPAISDYTEAIRINPNNATAFYNRGTVYTKVELDGYHSYADTIDRSLIKDYGFLEYYISKGKISKAVQDFSDAIRINPDYAVAYNARGFVLYQLGFYSLAILDFTEAISINPNYAEAYYNRGEVYERSSNDSAAITDFSEAIRINPNYFKAYLQRGKLYFNSYYETRREEAISDFSEVIRIEPDYAEAYLWRAIANYDSDMVLVCADLKKSCELEAKFCVYYNDECR